MIFLFLEACIKKMPSEVVFILNFSHFLGNLCIFRDLLTSRKKRKDATYLALGSMQKLYLLYQSAECLFLLKCISLGYMLTCSFIFSLIQYCLINIFYIHFICLTGYLYFACQIQVVADWFS